MPVVKSHEEYFNTVYQFNTAPEWQQELLLKGSLLKKCNEIEPVSVRLRLQRFWDTQAAKLGASVRELKSWR
ncbi:hypothetical protein ACCS91_33670 [Rhizobium ruizarguesonis]|uniref:hypothetical protein n=1 Tax=Rhizobium ruizarguesonis TaxID=2081791 RepID=UPI00163AE18D|nr:hypothetical protein [Rhizobium ruizarguesonis]MBC2806616.1 hypothetical protein [Rhizobium ruizarguesonis]